MRSNVLFIGLFFIFLQPFSAVRLTFSERVRRHAWLLPPNGSLHRRLEIFVNWRGRGSVLSPPAAKCIKLFRRKKRAIFSLANSFSSSRPARNELSRQRLFPQSLENVNAKRFVPLAWFPWLRARRKANVLVGSGEGSSCRVFNFIELANATVMDGDQLTDRRALKTEVEMSFFFSMQDKDDNYSGSLTNRKLIICALRVDGGGDVTLVFCSPSIRNDDFSFFFFKQPNRVFKMRHRCVCRAAGASFASPPGDSVPAARRPADGC